MENLHQAIHTAQKEFREPVSWRLSPDALRLLALRSTPGDLSLSLADRTLLGLPYAEDRTLNGCLAELVTDPPAGRATLASIYDERLAMVPAITCEVEERRP